MSDKLILALDVDSIQEARRLVRLFRDKVSLYKVGLGLFTSAGPDVVRMVQDEGGRVFLDLKFHDIPNTVAQACEVAARLHVFMINVHARGGTEMMKAAAAAVGDRSILLGVTVLTSDKETKDTRNEVVRLATEAKNSGLGGVVCSGQEARSVREACGKDFVIVTPGIRPAQSPSMDDQRRKVTPSEALRNGSDYLVVGRPVLESPNPIQALDSILSEMLDA
ncbi:MAG TPA: orotidine-5'-phosphate decarboxylase [bacterium]|nr:orotidine-5'-phosphate decarboxylase [bacterium]